MPYTLPRLEDLFANVDSADKAALAQRLDLAKTAVADSEGRTQRGEFRYIPGSFSGEKVATPQQLLEQLSKSVSPDVYQGISGQLDQLNSTLADLGKDLSLTSPLSTGLVPYDLEAPAKLLTPRRRHCGTGSPGCPGRAPPASSGGSWGSPALAPAAPPASSPARSSTTPAP